ncbi:hypothetical protein POL68_32930 [Stigmatella sp. ncwal1]|uniref:LysM domain-containing protein n=1 Tax=Stigmatella ashevillensis TaxID=2995309 RepID=A0ABT5DIB6_9BACT|nr:hypothetical protein [Stigmatella ashevillena]MDC0713314.1 hypothetical protein [Stigmatella ashevillena]
MSLPTKLVIKAYKTPDFSGEAGAYTVRVNPEKYSQSFEVRYNEEGSAGSMNVPLTFDHMLPSRLRFELLFDVTGALPNSATDLAEEINSFLSVVYNYQGSIHEPYYLKLYWGSLVFGARLMDLQLQYTLFRPDGSPLRARAEVSFASFVDPKTMAKQENKQSADLTHVVTVREGDSLPLLCQRIYGDATCYPWVARANGLTHFQRLRAGTRLVFPPMK